MKKRGQMKLSFGMIFSIILIIVFLAFAFFAVKKFIGWGDSAQITQFKNNFQSDIDKLWAASQGSQQEEYFLPTKITYLCFLDYYANVQGINHQDFYSELELFYHGSENLFFYPPESADGLESAEIKHIDIGEITTEENPFCIKNDKGKIKLVLKKDFGESLVRVTR